MALEMQPDLILLDHRLPHVESLAVLSSLREVAPGARVLMLIVKEDAHDLAQALHAGACGHLRKTIDAQALVQALVTAADGDDCAGLRDLA